MHVHQSALLLTQQITFSNKNILARERPLTEGQHQGS